MILAHDPIIQFEGVTMVYGRHTLLNCQDLEIGDNERVAIVGESGNGKTTTLNLIRGYCRPTKGTVRVSGRQLDYRSGAMNRLWASTPLIAQDANSGMTLLPYLTACQNTALICRLQGMSRSVARHRAESLLHRVGVGHRMHAKPGMISGGERQRVAVAMALAFDSHLILADEPTASLDSQTSRDVLRLMRESGRTLVIVTHEAALVAPYVDRILMLRSGRFYDITAAKQNPGALLQIGAYADLDAQSHRRIVSHPLYVSAI